MVLRMLSPPGTSPTPVLPALSCRITMLRVKNGPCAPLRFINMLSRPATGTTRSSVTVGVAFDGVVFVDMRVGPGQWVSRLDEESAWFIFNVPGGQCALPWAVCTGMAWLARRLRARKHAG